MAATEYARNGLFGVLTPQANTTVEPEFAFMTPPGYAFLTGRLTSAHRTIESRLIDYAGRFESEAGQFANAPIAALALACTGTSYLTGRAEEDRMLKAMRARLAIPVETAATAVVACLEALGARAIALVSPYAGALDEACGPYWEARGFQVAAKASAARESAAFHPIYALPSDAAAAALDGLPESGIDAIVMLGTGMPTLAPIARRPYVGAAPVLSCMTCLGLSMMAALDGHTLDAARIHAWITTGPWRRRALEAVSGGA